MSVEEKVELSELANNPNITWENAGNNLIPPVSPRDNLLIICVVLLFSQFIWYAAPYVRS